MKPLVSLNQINILRDTSDLTLSIKEKSENLSSLDIEFARLDENNEDILEWKSFDEEWLNEEFIAVSYTHLTLPTNREV